MSDAGASLRAIVAERIREARLDARLSRRELASRVGVSVRTVATWEAGTRTPRYEKLARVAAATGLDPAWFLDPGDERRSL